ncbi:hypothetical protein [Pontibacter litorisediminis]|uniref:hypothetical protein n=1 Tax=Pontibacter litorisediminis TaxID=1846260 RepID=UPI0023EAF0CF|nr:hypothetical protein [Pontibacter litorisediminis]
MSFGFLFFLNSCIPSTTYTSSVGGCPKAFKSGERVLMGEATGISPHQSYRLYQQFADEVKEAGLVPSYAVEQEMVLRMHGIQPGMAADSSSLSVMQRLGYNYFIKVHVGNTASGTGYNSVSAAEQRELQAGYGTQAEDETKASVTFELYATGSRQRIYTLAATTSMGGVTLPNRDTENGYRGSKSANLSSVTQAIDMAFKKGVKKVLEECR